MSVLQKRRTLFNLSNAEVMSNSAPTSEAGIEKSAGHDGFFLHSKKGYSIWFKDAGGSWNLFDSYNDAQAREGIAFNWGDNQAAFIETQQSPHAIIVFVIETKAVSTHKTPELKDLNNVSNNRLNVHSNYKKIRMKNSGHTGEAYAIAIFDENGNAAYVSAPPSGQREGKILGWDSSGNLGWVVDASSVVDIMGETAGIENEGALNGGAYFSNTGAVILDGVDSYVQTDDNYHFPDQFQVGANIKPTNLDGDFQTIAGTRNYDGSANGFILQIKDGVIRATGPQADNFVLDAPIPADIDMEDGEFHEIKLKWIEDTELTIFLDGEPIGTHTPSGATRGGVEDMEIGRNPKNKNMHFEGEIDGVKVENEVQTEEEILNEFIAKVLGNDPSPADYSGIEDLGTTTMMNGASLKGSGHLALDGSNYAEAETNHHYADFFTVTAWFRTVKHDSDWGVICSSRKWNGSGNGFAMAIKNNAIHLHHPQTNNTHIEPTFDHVEVSDGSWHQVVLRWKANEDLSAFVDGVKVGSLVPAGDINAGVGNLLIGTEPLNFSGMFVGHIDGVKVENVYKSDVEIMSGFTGNPIITLLGSNPMGAFKAPFVDPGASAVDHPDGDLTAQITSDWNTVVGANPAMGDYVVTYSVTDSDGNQNTVTRNVTIGDGLEDIATLQNGATRPSGDLILDGVNDYGSIPSSNEYDLDGGDMSVRCWFKTDNALGGGRGLITKGHGSVTWKGWGLYLHDAGGVAFNMWSSAGGGGANRNNYMGSPSDWNVGEWNHIALVMRTTDTWKLYINGQLLNEFTPASITTSTDAELRIGATKITNNNAFGHPFDGEIKKALIDKTALSAADILAEYNLGAPPEITILGDNPYQLSSLDDTDPGATANDAIDGDVTANIVSDWDTVVDAGLAAGVHNITYSVTDSHGNSKSATREIWNGTIEDWGSTALHGDASRANGILTLGGNGYAIADSNHHYDDYFYLDFWIKTDSLQPCTNTGNWSGMVVPVSTRAWNGNYNGFTIGMSSTHINIHVPYHNSVYTYDLAGEEINDNQWHYFGFTFVKDVVGGMLTVFIDGQGKHTFSWTGGSPIGGSQGLNIGRDPHSGNFRFIGDINHVSVTNEMPGDVMDRYLAKAPAVITLLGDSPMNIASLPTTDPGATASEPGVGDLTSQITSDWDAVVGANPNNGSYSVTYSVTSSKGEVVTRTRNVEVAVAAVYPDSNFLEEWPFRATPIGTSNGLISLVNENKELQGNALLEIPSANLNITDTYSLSFWVKDGAPSNSEYFLDFGGIQARFDPTWYRIRFLNGVTGATSLVGYNVLPTNTWHHILVIVETDENSQTSVKIYRNQVLDINTTAAKASDLSLSSDLTIKACTNRYLDSIEIVDFALTSTGIANLFAGGRGTSMLDIVNSTAPVVHNLTHEPILAGPSAAQITHNMRSNTDLYGFNRWMNSSHIPLYNFCNDKYTFSVWFKVTGGFGPLVVSHYDALTTGIWLESLNDGLKYGTPNGTQTIYDWPVDKDTSFADGEWHHVVATFDHEAGSRSLYLDGVKMTGGDDTFQALSGNPNNEALLFYARWGTPQRYGYQGTPGRYGNIHLLNYVLTDSQISDIYNAGYRGITIEASDVPSAPAGYVQDVEDGNGVIVATNNWDAIIGASPAAGNYTVTYSATDSHGDSTDLDVSVVVLEDETPPAVITTADLEEFYPDAQGASQPVTINENAELVNGMYRDTVDGEGHVSGVFTDNLRPLTSDEGFSFSAFYRTHPDSNMGSNTSTHHLFDCQDFNNNAGWKLYVNPHFDTRWSFGLERNGLTLFSTGHIEPLDAYTGKFHHVAFTSQSGVIKVYYNGVLVHTENNATFLPGVPAHGEYRIGNDFMSRFATDKVTIYKNKVLTQEEITALQDEKATLDAAFTANFPANDGVENDPALTLHNGATLTDGVLAFDNASNSYASLPHSEELDIDQQDTTIHFWFYPTSTTFGNGNAQTILAKHNTGSNPNNYEGYAIAYGDRKHPTLGTPGETGIKIFSCVGACGGGTHNKIFRVAGNVPLNQWHHVAISYNMATSVHTCYFNGQPIGTWNQSIPNGTMKDLKIGGSGDAHQSLDGKIKGITYEDSVLSDGDVLAIYNADKPGLEDGATLHNGATRNAEGSLVLDGTNYAESDSNHHYSDFFYASAWIKTTSHQASEGRIFSSRKWDGSGNGFHLAIKDDNIRAGHPQHSNNEADDSFAHVSLSDGNWHHVAVRWIADNELATFVDGVKVGTSTPSGAIRGGQANLHIGTEPLNFGTKFIGEIKDVKVENANMTDADILAEFNAG